jgi:hypothetical protein
MKFGVPLLALMLMIVLASASPGPVSRFGGTFIGAMIAEEGIVMASDSRSTFIDDSGKPLGYVDRMPKVFAERGAAFAVSGLISVDGDLFSAFIRENSFLLERSPDEILMGVSLWLPFKNSTSVLLISAGYMEGVPTICARSPHEPQTCQKSGYITNKSSGALRRWLAARNGRMPRAEEAASALKLAIREAADLDPMIGGPTTVLLLTKNGLPQWLENRPTDNGWTRVCDIVSDYRQGRTPIFFTNSKYELDRHLIGVCPR